MTDARIYRVIGPATQGPFVSNRHGATADPKIRSGPVAGARFQSASFPDSCPGRDV